MFVQKDKSRHSKPIKITSEEKLQELIDAQEKKVSYRSAVVHQSAPGLNRNIAN